MFRRVPQVVSKLVQAQSQGQLSLGGARASHAITWKPEPLNSNPFLSHHLMKADETDEEFDQRFLDYFNREDLDGWMLRKGLSQLHTYDVIPEPKIIIAALKAMRRVNDYSLTTRFLESIKFKCGPKKMQDIIYPYLLQEIKPTLDELGISTPEELGFDKIELFYPHTDWWEKEYYAEYGLDKNPLYNIEGRVTNN
jgi:cytochrome c oxidase subunit 5a